MGSFWYSLLLVVHILLGCSVIGFVLLQHGKGADMGAAFGSGASGSVFGSSGSANFLSRMTAGLASAFFVTSLTLSYMAAHSHVPVSGSVMDAAEVVVPSVTVSAPVGGAPKQDIPK
jgi:preprotein translocase subunit SecG